MIAILDYGMGNVGSILNMLKKIGADAEITGNFQAIDKADKLILPGVGSFDTGMTKLKEMNLVSIICEHAMIKKKPILGICLGMQIMGRRSEEGKEKGLGLIPFDNVKFSFPDKSELKIPHMGWDKVSMYNTESPLLYNLDNQQRYYFVHSYHANCDKEDNILMKCDYGYEFVSAVSDGNIYGVQFHPEKSHRFGMALLENFAWRC